MKDNRKTPHEVWITIEQSKWKPKIEYPPVNVTYVSGKAFEYGIEKHKVNRASIRVYSPAKTVADCFKFRNKIGLDVAIEALKEDWRVKAAGIDEIMEASKICRVSKVIRPYLEAIV